MTAVSPQTLFIDLEGTVYTREGVVPRAPETLDELRSAGHNLRFLTNTDSVATSTIVQRVHDLGLDIGPEEVFTPVTAARVLLAREDDVRVLALTSTSVAAELSEQLTLVDAAASPTHVVVGDVRDSLDHGLLDAAFGALHAGAALVALQRGRFYLSGGVAHIDTGAIVAALEYAAGVTAQVVGKPNSAFLHLAGATVDPSRSSDATWVIGNDRTTDIPMGRAAGARTVQVRTGKFALQDDEPHAGADHTVDSVAELPALIRGVLA